MLLSELADILDALQYSDRTLWESQRLTAYMMAQTHCSKKLKLTDVYKLPFDADNSSEKLTPEDIKELRERQQAVEDFINEQVAAAREQAQTKIDNSIH